MNHAKLLLRICFLLSCQFPQQAMAETVLSSERRSQRSRGGNRRSVHKS
jgi:hypothetical protein